MSNPSKQKGTAWESALVRYLQENGFPLAERRALSGVQDRGDVAGVHGWVLEAKACKQITLSSFVDEAMAEARNAGAPYGAAVIKRSRKPTAAAYVVMPLSQFVTILNNGLSAT